MSFIKSINQTLILALALVALLGYQFMSAQIWKAPAGSPPANNVQAPINIGTSTQSRQQGSGALVFNRFAAVNAVWSNQYCDAVGGNCFSPSAVSGSKSCPSQQYVTGFTAAGALICGSVSAPSSPTPTPVTYSWAPANNWYCVSYTTQRSDVICLSNADGSTVSGTMCVAPAPVYLRDSGTCAR